MSRPRSRVAASSSLETYKAISRGLEGGGGEVVRGQGEGGGGGEGEGAGGEV